MNTIYVIKELDMPIFPDEWNTPEYKIIGYVTTEREAMKICFNSGFASKDDFLSGEVPNKVYESVIKIDKEI